jgi:molybdenum cofactor biosynthesis enzyme
VEMEALTAASVAGLTVYDMVGLPKHLQQFLVLRTS